MALLLDVYNGMIKEAEEAQENAVMQERVEVLNKYAEAATELLNAEFPNNYSKQDVVELADRLIQRDIEIENANQKTAEAVELLNEYVKVARELLVSEYGDTNDAQVEKLASTLFELDAEEDFNKEAEAISEFAFLDEFNKLAGTAFESIEALEAEVEKVAGGKAGLLTSMQKNVTKGVKQMGAYMKKNPGQAAGIGAGVVGAGALGLGVGRSGGDN